MNINTYCRGLWLLLICCLCRLAVFSHTEASPNSTNSTTATASTSSTTSIETPVKNNSTSTYVHDTYHVLIDSGSTGSRVYVYRYLQQSPVDSLQEVAAKRVRPALSTFYGNYTAIKRQMKELVRFAQKHVSPEMRGKTSISLKATAGLRIMPQDQQEWIISRIRGILKNTSFAFDPYETRVLSGGEEALFGLLATNAAFADLTAEAHTEGLKLGAADLGGSSKQVAFMLPWAKKFSLDMLGKLSWSWLWGAFGSSYPDECKADYRLIVPGSSKRIEVFARSIPGLGLVEALRDTIAEMGENYIREQMRHEYQLRHRMTQSARFSYGGNNEDIANSDDNQFEADGLPRYPQCSVMCPSMYYGTPMCDEELHYIGGSLVVDNELDNDDDGNSTRVLYNPCVGPGERYPYLEPYHTLPWVGTGDFDACVGLIKDRLYRKAHREIQCMKKLKTPTIIAMDNFPRVLEVLKLANDATVSPAAIREAAIQICKRSWPDILAEFPGFYDFRAHQACFGASYIYAITTELYGLHEMDTTSFLPTDSHHAYTVGWPLGAAIYSAMNWSFEDLNAREENIGA